MISITIASATPADGAETTFELVPGATIAEALNAAALLWQQDATELARVGVGIWGKARPHAYILRDGDRVEIYRPLQADPKDARRAKVSAAENEVAERGTKCVR